LANKRLFINVINPWLSQLQRVAVETKDNSLCQTFEDPAQKESCLLQVQNAIDVAAAQK
jgi:hypothetical protein